MDKRPPPMPVSLLRGFRLALHLLYAALLALPYPHLNRAGQRRMLKIWSRQLLGILNVGICTVGQRPMQDEGGRVVIANHVSWLDIFVLNATCPSHFIAKAEVRHWALIGWLCQRSDTIFIERNLRRDAAAVNLRVGTLLRHGGSVGLFPEGTTTDGKQVSHFHSALIQPAIDAGAMLCPIALRYQNNDCEQSSAASFTGDMTLTESIWRILRSPRFDALLVFTPALATTGGNRRILARAAQEAIAQGLQNAAAMRQAPGRATTSVVPQMPPPVQSAWQT